MGIIDDEEEKETRVIKFEYIDVYWTLIVSITKVY
jgi:hypothetical protein